MEHDCCINLILLSLKRNEKIATPEAPGVNKAIKLPTYPRSSLTSPNGVIVSSSGTKAGE
jgi:hypothetical protein